MFATVGFLIQPNKVSDNCLTMASLPLFCKFTMFSLFSFGGSVFSYYLCTTTQL